MKRVNCSKPGYTSTLYNLFIYWTYSLQFNFYNKM